MEQEREPVGEHLLSDGLRPAGRRRGEKPVSLSFPLLIKSSDRSFHQEPGPECLRRGSCHPQSLPFLSFSTKPKRREEKEHPSSRIAHIPKPPASFAPRRRHRGPLIAQSAGRF